MLWLFSSPLSEQERTDSDGEEPAIKFPKPRKPSQVGHGKRPGQKAVGKKVAEKIPVKKDDKLKAKVYRALSPNKLNLKVPAHGFQHRGKICGVKLALGKAPALKMKCVGLEEKPLGDMDRDVECEGSSFVLPMMFVSSHV
eukprot:symbB.v1.2.037570.t1/scaffold5581.1/size25636/3